MAKITITLPRTITKDNELFVDVIDMQQLFLLIKNSNASLFDILFHEMESKVTIKSFLAIFINNEQIFELDYIFQDEDKVTFRLAIAGG